MIFLIVGSQKFPFDRLITEVDRLNKAGVIKDNVVAQIGVSGYVPETLDWVRFMDKERFDECIENSDLVITHAGEGSIMTGLLKKKKVIAVPRYARLGEHVSDHQLEIARALGGQNYIINVEDISELGDVISNIDKTELREYSSGKDAIIKTIRDFING